MRNNDEFEVPVEIPSAEDMLKKAEWAYDKRQQARRAIKEAIETAAENGSTFVEITGKLPDSIVNELENLGYRVIGRRLIWVRPDGHYEKVKIDSIADRIRDALNIPTAKEIIEKGIL